MSSSRKKGRRQAQRNVSKRNPSPKGQRKPASVSTRSSHPIQLFVLVIIVALVVLIVHYPALSARAQSFDDHQYMTRNVLVQNPSWTSAGRFITEVFEPSTVRGYYQPLAMISLMLDYATGGSENNFRPFHRTSLALHVANTALVVVLLYMLFGQTWPAAIVGLLFGLHPITVEAIPWVGERKTLLAAFFALLCLISYVRYARKGGWKLYMLVAFLYLLALMSKPTSTPLPVLFLLLDYWPLRRLNQRALIEKLPLFVLGGIFAVITVISQGRTASIVMPGETNPMRIPLILGHNIIFYLYKIVWPVNLSSHYPFPDPLSLSDSSVLAGVVGTCILLTLLIISLRWTRALLVGWLFFFVAILPTMGIIGFTMVIASDKFAYLPSVGLLLILTWFICRWDRGPSRYGITRGQAGILVMALMLAGLEARATRRYLHVWRDTESLFRHILALTPNLPVPHNMLGQTLAKKGKTEEALIHFKEALHLDPEYRNAHNNLGIVLEELGRTDEAIKHYKEALRLEPESTYTLNNLAALLVEQKRYDEAVERYQEALSLDSDNPRIHNNLGHALTKMGKYKQAIERYHIALNLKPDFPYTFYYLAEALSKIGETDKAIAYYKKALQLKPDYIEAHNGLGILLAKSGKTELAIAQFKKALKYAPESYIAHCNLGTVLVDQGRVDEAIGVYRSLLKIRPRDAEVCCALGYLLSEKGLYDEAISVYHQALSIDPNNQYARNQLNALIARKMQTNSP